MSLLEVYQLIKIKQAGNLLVRFWKWVLFYSLTMKWKPYVSLIGTLMVTNN